MRALRVGRGRRWTFPTRGAWPEGNLRRASRPAAPPAPARPASAAGAPAPGAEGPPGAQAWSRRQVLVGGVRPKSRRTGSQAHAEADLSSPRTPPSIQDPSEGPRRPSGKHGNVDPEKCTVQTGARAATLPAPGSRLRGREAGAAEAGIHEEGGQVPGTEGGTCPTLGGCLRKHLLVQDDLSGCPRHEGLMSSCPEHPFPWSHLLAHRPLRLQPQGATWSDSRGPTDRAWGAQAAPQQGPASWCRGSGSS